MASGKPIISTVKMGYSIIEKYNCGIELKNNTAEDLAKAILKVKEFPEEQYKSIGKNAFQAAKSFDFNALTDKLEMVLKSVLQK